MTKQEIFSRDWYEYKVYVLSSGQFETISIDSAQRWDFEKAYNALGATKKHFPTVSDFIIACLSYR